MSQVSELKDELKEVKAQRRATAKDHAELIAAVKDVIAQLKGGGTGTGTSTKDQPAEQVPEWALRDYATASLAGTPATKGASSGAGQSPQIAAAIAELEAAIGVEQPAPQADTAAVEGADAPAGQA